MVGHFNGAAATGAGQLVVLADSQWHRVPWIWADNLLYRISNCFVKQEMQKKIALYENILPVCSYCHKIRDDRQAKAGEGPWYSLEEYFSRVQGINFSHGCCPACFAKEMGSYIQDKGW